MPLLLALSPSFAAVPVLAGLCWPHQALPLGGGGSCEGNMIYIKKYIYLYIFFIYIKKKKRNVGLQKVCALVFRSQQ